MMTPLTIERFNLKKLNNAEFAGFMEYTNTLIAEAGHAALGIPKEMIDQFSADDALLTDIGEQSRISDLTLPIARADAECGALLSYLLSSIATGRRSPDRAVAEHFRSLSNATKPFRGLQRLAYRQQITQTKALIFDLRKEKLQAHVTALGLDALLEQITVANDHFDKLIDTRANEQIATGLPAIGAIRPRMIGLYRAMMLFAQSAANVAGAAEPALAFIPRQNKLIGDTRAAYNRRMGIYHHWEKRREEHRAEAEAARARGDEAAAALAEQEAVRAARARRDAALLTAAEAKHTAHVADELLNHRSEV